MWEGSYGSEPFDLRLTVLRLLRSLHKILLITLIGSVLFGVGYYAKNVIFAEELYNVTITCKLQYTDPPTKSGDYCINAVTWDTYVHTREFLDMVMSSEPLIRLDSWPVDLEQLGEAISADLPSDINIPVFTVTGDREKIVEDCAEALAKTLTGPWPEKISEIESIEILDMTPVHLVKNEFLRPGRAFVFGAVAAGFFAVVLFLLREIGADSIWLPATLRTRYGLPALGTVEDTGLAENVRYAFSEKQGLLRRVAVCAADDGIDPAEVIRAMREKEALNPEQEWIPVPAPGLSPETARKLRETDGVLMAVSAGLHTGKPLEYTLEFFREQDIKITGVLLWKPDERLIRDYYRLPGGNSTGTPREKQ